MMAMRLARPTRLIDISRIAAFSYVRDEATPSRSAHHAAMRRRARCADRGQALPLLASIPFIGHAATRARGTIGGSLANADPAAELPLIAVTLDATLRYRAAARPKRCRRANFSSGR